MKSLGFLLLSIGAFCAVIAYTQTEAGSSIAIEEEIAAQNYAKASDFRRAIDSVKAGDTGQAMRIHDEEIRKTVLNLIAAGHDVSSPVIVNFEREATSQLSSAIYRLETATKARTNTQLFWGIPAFALAGIGVVVMALAPMEPKETKAPDVVPESESDYSSSSIAQTTTEEAPATRREKIPAQSLVLKISETEQTMIYLSGIVSVEYSDDYVEDGEVVDGETISQPARDSKLKITPFNGSPIELDDEYARKVWKFLSSCEGVRKLKL